MQMIRHRLRRDEGWTFIEATLSIVIMSIMVLGLTIVILAFKEHLERSWAVRMMDQYGNDVMEIITHDLRNVMVGLRTAEWEMAQGAVSSGLRDVFTLSLASIDGLLRTLQLLHEYARTGSLALQPTSVEPAAMIQDALALSRMDPLFQRRRVRSEIAAGLPDQLRPHQGLAAQPGRG